uniref:Uncharacterized protein n=1 Tax=Panagrolaimus sp. PS1159 TaxID=55785 RepID=A0AC35FBA6_9BILA
MINEKTADSLECVDKIEENVLSETKTISTHSTADYGY